MDYIEYYYGQIVGCYPFNTDEERSRTEKTIKYLIDAEISEQEIIRFIQEAPAVGVLTPSDLPDWLWEGSLLKRDTFYYHNILHIKSAAPVFNPVTRKEIVCRFYLEMKIKFTMDQLIAYFYRTLGIDTLFLDRKKDTGSFNYLLDKYKVFFNTIEPIDIVLAEIDYAKANREEAMIKVNNVLAIDAFLPEVYEELKSKVAEASLAKANQIIWR